MLSDFLRHFLSLHACPMAGFSVHSDEMIAESNNDIGVSPAIRKSCHFCRSRKIRCSGQRVCAACSARNLDCVYGREASKGRPRGSTSNSSSNRSASYKDTKSAGQRAAQNSNRQPDEPMPTFVDPVICKQQSRDASPTLSTDLSSFKAFGSNTKHNELIATELENSFRRIFLDHPPQDTILGGPIPPMEPTRPIWEAVAAEDPVPTFTSGTSTPTTTTTAPVTVTYKRLFFGLVPGLVELVSARFGSLGFCHSDDTLTQYFASSLAQDRTISMFDTNTSVEAPPKYNDHQVCQMVELWFFHHPLSFIISKTLLLHGYRSGTHDESLLAIILAGASFALNDAGSKPGQNLFQWAQSRLCHRNTGSLGLASIQSLILLGWHEICMSRARRGDCYLEMARVAIIDFHTRLNETPRTDIDWINGVDVGKVELELSQRMYWLTFALELWAALQKDVPFLHPMPPDVEVKFPPLDEASSAVLTLDKESGNIATLRAQEKAMRELWPLSHIASTIESIYALYPRQLAVAATFPASGWVSQTLPRLRHLLDSPNNLADVCHRIRDILADGLDKFQAGMGSHPSEIFTLSVYRTLIIHLLFPRPSSGESAPRMTEAVLNDTMRFVTAFKDMLNSLDQPHLAQNVLVESSEPANAQMLVLGLDTCSRALYQLYALSKAGSPLDQDRMMMRQGELVRLTRDLHVISKHPKLRAVPTLSMVKKSLKCVKQCFERHSSTSNSTPSTGLTPQVSRNDPWAGSLNTAGAGHGNNMLTSLLPDASMLPMIGNPTFDLSSDFISDGNIVNWTEDEWAGLSNRVPFSGTTTT